MGTLTDRIAANRILDESLGGEGPSPIRFQHDADQVLGRIRRDGGWDRRYKIRHAPPEPVEPEGWRFFLEVAVGTLVYGGLILGLWLWVGIAGAVQP